MKANQFFNKILDKWLVKVCCLIIAIALYLFHQASLTDKRSFVIPLQVVEEGSVIHTGDYNSNITVIVRANTEEISSVHSNQITAYVSLNELTKQGEYNLPVKVKVSEELMAFDPFEIKVKPEYIKLKVDSKELKYIPVEPVIVGEPEHGYEITDVSIEPAFIEVIGPKSIIDNTQNIYTEMIDVSGISKKEYYDVEYKPVNKLLTVAENGPFEVSVLVEPKPMERVFENITVNVLSLKDKFYLKDDIIPVTITLEGTMPVLENYTPGKRFVTLDLQRINEPGEYDIPLLFNVPSYLKIKDFSLDSVHITVLEKEEQNENIEGEVE